LTIGYNHQIHAGNAGDVWKHFILVEVAEHLLFRDKSLVYAESHVGRPEYSISSPGEWENGISRLWQYLPVLHDFLYFRMLADLNPQGLRLYPGSSSLVLETAKRRGALVQAEIWDIDSDLAACWRGFSDAKFHCADGFSGVLSILDCSNPGLLLIDPPYLDPKDIGLAKDLLRRAENAGWIVLWWYMSGLEMTPQVDFIKCELEFSRAGMDGGKWKGAAVALAGADDLLVEFLRGQAEKLLKIVQNSSNQLLRR
jgi:23S rRNA (adenine2030-N6)-methyltransferase